MRSNYNHIFFSIVICTFKRLSLVKGEIDSFIHQKPIEENWELIIVDNEPQENFPLKTYIQDIQSELNIWYHHEPVTGLVFARNSGGKIARADYIGYVDDDALVNPNYISVVKQVILAQAPDIFGGPYFPFYMDKKPVWFKDKYGTSSLGDSPLDVPENEYLSGGNIFYRKKILEEVGWFSPGLGMLGDKINYGEETELLRRVQKMFPGLKYYYHPGLSIQHLVPKQKMALGWRLKSAMSLGRSQARVWPGSSGRVTTSRWKILFRFMRFFFVDIIIFTIPGVLFRNRKKYPFWQNYIYEVTARSVGLASRQIELLKLGKKL